MTALAASPAPNDSAVVRHHGRLNLAVAPVIRQQLVDLVAEGNTRIVVDLADVEVIDAAAIGALITGMKAARTPRHRKNPPRTPSTEPIHGSRLIQ